MAGVSLADLVTRGGARDALGPRGRERQQHKAALVAHLAAPVCARIFERYACLTGTRELPITCNENQLDAHRTQYASSTMTDVCEDLFAAIRERDAGPDLASAAAAAAAPRVQVMAQKKWLLPHDGTLGERADRKRVSEAVVRRVLCAYYGGRGSAELATFLDRVDAAGDNRHDMCDALLQAMEEALRTYARFVRTVLPRRRPGEERSDTPVLSAAEMGGGGTLRVLGFDPGTTNAGLCLLEFGGMTLRAPHEAPVPVFRILLLQLVNLKRAATAHGGHHAVQSYAPAKDDSDALWLRPRPLEDGGGYDLAARTAALFGNVAALKVRKPRKRSVAAAAAAEAAATEAAEDKPLRKKRKKAEANEKVCLVDFPHDH